MLLGFLAISILACAQAFDRTLKIPIPERSVSSPTQKLNREGVAQLKHGHREKAKHLFYRAYLIDPQDPFTLNNLGYISELEGDGVHALRYYDLAARSHTDALIDQSSAAELKGRPLDEAFRKVATANQQVSKINEQAIVLFQKGQTFEARNMLRSAVVEHPKDPFLLNNLGYAMESVGDLNEALRCYSAAASIHSTEKVVVTPSAKWRGRPISEVAAQNAEAISQQIARGEGVEATAARLNLRGVAALNDNQPLQARELFTQAYQLDKQNAFTLNNLGYIAELEGDRESAEFYYQAASSSPDLSSKVSYSTRQDAEGHKIGDLATSNQTDVDNTLKTMAASRRRSQKPVELIRRDQTAPEANPGNKEDSTPVPPVGIEAPAMPALPPPSSEPQTPQAPN